jgi:S1-C subfamily serine protease
VALLALLVVGGWGGAHQNTATESSTSTGGTTVVVPPSAQDLQQTIINTIRIVQPSVVQITSSGSSQGGAIGSGEILTADGYIVTNDHVVAGFTQFTATFANGQTLPAHLVGGAPQEDLAVLKVAGSNMRPITFANSSTVQVGQFAIALGSPLGLEQSATQGIVSALDREASEGSSGPTLVGLIQTSAPINPGNSGGALVDLQGHLIGVPTLAAAIPGSGAPAPGIGFAIPSNRVTFVTAQLIRNGHLVSTGQGFLGIQGVTVTPQVASAYNLSVQSGVLITGFANDAAGVSPAQQAGLQIGDIIVAVDGKTIADQAQLAGTLLGLDPGTTVQVTVQRGSSQQTVAVKLGERTA